MEKFLVVMATILVLEITIIQAIVTMVTTKETLALILLVLVLIISSKDISPVIREEEEEVIGITIMDQVTLTMANHM